MVDNVNFQLFLKVIVSALEKSGSHAQNSGHKAIFECPTMGRIHGEPGPGHGTNLIPVVGTRET